jgi:hypothetical protein
MHRFRATRRTLIAGACAAGALLVPAGPGSAAPSPGDQEVRRALRAIDGLDRVGERLASALLVSGGGGVPSVVPAGERLRVRSAAAARSLRATGPTTPEGRRMKRLGIRVALLHREAARTVVASQRALSSGRTDRGVRFLLKAIALHGAIDRRTATVRRIVLPDPDAFVESITLVGVVSGGAAGSAAPPIVAGPGGTMTRCDTADEYVGFRVYALGVHGTSRATVVTTTPDGATDHIGARIDPADAGVEVTLPVRARGNGGYRLTVSQGARTLLDASVTRACR